MTTYSSLESCEDDSPGLTMNYNIYRVRWVILAAICATAVSRMYMAVSFELENDLVAEYLEVSSYQVDILATADAVMGVFVCILLAFVGQSVGVRTQSILSSGCMLVGSAIGAFAFFGRSYYWLLVLGRLITGIPAGLLYVLPTIFANAWFPPSEIATAFSLPLVGLNTGSMLSAIVFPSLLPKTTSDMEYNETLEVSTADERVKYIFVANMSVVAGIMVICTVLLSIYAADRPPTPPSRSQEMVLKQESAEPFSNSNATSSFQVIKKLSKSRPFLLITAANTAGNSSLALAIYLAPSLVRATFPALDYQSVGYMTISVAGLGALGSFVGGRIVDRFDNRYKDFAAWGTLGTILVSIALCLGHNFASQPVLFILYPLLSFVRAFTLTANIDFLVETTYPTSWIVLTSLHFASYNLGLFISTILERLAMNLCGEASAVLVSVFANVLALICILFVRPKYGRTEANRTAL